MFMNLLTCPRTGSCVLIPFLAHCLLFTTQQVAVHMHARRRDALTLRGIFVIDAITQAIEHQPVITKV